ncbi:TFIIA-alpha and beta-like factor isoform X1 [Ctenopharyngodon idella]|uniref:TFIIA-alpha and beta-like factor isoform X1 n=1 Tax=Ctenopharyngodon idella TaxID=7959 RepID=UPI00223190E1|nr:TFIIA-alpha and beta-like factor isoform X1 [Ctenopharyngodon idella]
MLSNANTLPKLYLSVMDDVMDSVRELFCDEGVDERVLDTLRQLWESKVVQSKAVEGFIKDNNPSNFVLQLPSNYTQTLHKPTVVIPAAQNVQNFSSKANNCGSVATFSLPPGITYPVQIPAGVTLQTASGHFYKVNVPVMVTRGAQHVLTRPASNLVSHPAAVARSIPAHLSVPCPPAPSGCVASETPPNPPQPLPHQLCQQTDDKPSPSASDSQSEFTLDGIEFSPQPIDMSASSFFTPPAQGPCSDYTRNVMETALKEPDGVDDEETALPDLQAKTSHDIKLETELQTDINFNQLVDIAQLDGVADSSSDTEEDDDEDDDDDDLGLVGENEFLGMINGNGEEELEEEEDPLNSGDDVSEQDIPEIFDTENVIVCQYDKIHRSKNRWKFYLKDGVMCFGGKDYVFSKAVGEAECPSKAFVAGELWEFLPFCAL